MAYVYTPQTPPRRAGIARTSPNLPVRVVTAPRGVVRSVAPRAQVVRMRYGTSPHLGEYLGIVPLVAAAIPSVKDLAAKALNSVIGIVDPGKKRDANRKARADIWCGLANAGSITAARRVLGGSKVQYTAKERQYYIDCWQKLMASKPALCQQAITLGQLGIPEPGSDVAPPSLSEEDQQSLQREIDAYNTALQTNAPLPGPATAKALPAAGQSTASLGPVIGIAIAGALLKKVL